MKKYFWVIFIIFSCAFSPFNEANAFMHFKQGEYLEKHQWGALEDIMNDLKTGKISTDECALYGCYILATQEPARADRIEKSKLLPSKYMRDKKSTEAGPYFFIYFLYKNEDKFGKKALDEFKNSDWCEDEYLNEVLLNPKVDEALQNLFSLPKKEIMKKIKFFNNKYSLYDTLIYLSENNIISSEAAYIIIGCEVENPKKFHRMFDQLLINKYNLSGWFDLYFPLNKLNEKLSKTKNRKVSNILNFYNLYSHLYFKYGRSDDDYSIGNFIVKGGTKEENKEFGDYFEKYFKKLCKQTENEKDKYLQPINFINGMKIEISLLKDFQHPYTGTAVSHGNNNIIDYFDIKLDLNEIKRQKNLGVLSPEKCVIHEFFHTIQASYVKKENDFYWYSINHHGDQEEFVGRFKESTAVWAEDYYYDNNDNFKEYLQTIYFSARYFFGQEYLSNATSFPQEGFTNAEEYSLGFFWNYYCRLYGNDSIRKIFEKMILSTEYMKASESMKSYSNDKKFINIFHEFSLNNFLISKQLGIDPLEKEFINANQRWGKLESTFPSSLIIIDKEILPEYIVNTGKTTVIPIVSSDPNVPVFSQWSTKLIKIKPDKNIFENSTFIKLFQDNSVVMSLIAVWVEVDNNDNISNSKLKYSVHNFDINEKAPVFRYYSKKGLNPLYYIVVITQCGDKFNVEHSPFNIEVTIDKPSNLPNVPLDQIIADAGKNYFNDIYSLLAKGPITQMSKMDSEICELYDKYLISRGDDANFYARQIMQKVNNLNLLMQTTIVQVHDLMFQYYLLKNRCVAQITDGASSSSVAKQVKNLENFIMAIDLKDQINIANAYVVFNHSDLKLKSTKQVDPTEWEMSQQAYDKINLIAKTINNYSSNNKYEFWYTKIELSEAVTSPYVGIPDDECPGSIVTPPLPPSNGPFAVNCCPAMRKTLDKLKIQTVYTLSSKLKGLTISVDGSTYSAKNLLCEKEKCDPLSLKYFSALKKHKYHEQNMPPAPSASNVKDYISSLGYFMKICKNNSLNNNENLLYVPSDIMIKGASNRIMEIIVLLADAIINEKNINKTDLYDAFKLSVSQVTYANEIQILLEKELKKEGFTE